jgi:hypothetical protein
MDLSIRIDKMIVGKLGQGMRACKCTSHDLYVVGVSDSEELVPPRHSAVECVQNG